MTCQHPVDVLLSTLANQAALYHLPFRKVSGVDLPMFLDASPPGGSLHLKKPCSRRLRSDQDGRGTCWFLYPYQWMRSALGMHGSGERERGTLVRQGGTGDRWREWSKSFT